MSDDQSIIERIRLARGTTEPSIEAPTENAEVVNVSEDAPIEEVVEAEETHEEITSKVEESATEEEAQSEETDLFYYDLDGEEVSSDQLKEWKSNGLMQADYTRKTQELADSRKDFEAERETMIGQQSKLAEQLATLEAMISEDAKTTEELADMREYEPEEYIKYTEKQSKRKELLKSAKQQTPVSTVDVQAEQSKLWEANPSWMDNGKQTKAFTDDMALVQEYASKQGYTNDEINGIQSAHHWQTLIDAAKFKASSNKSVSLEKRVRKAPVSTKPQAAKSNALGDKIAKQKAKLKRTGRNEDFVALRQLQKQLNN